LLVIASKDASINGDTLWLDEVSLFPQNTYMGRENGLRLDLANKLVDLNPSFYRYPGGNFIESWNVANAVRWKKTIGPVEDRTGHLNDAWGYWSTDGYGLDEFFLQCSDMGMEPIYGINAGLMLGYNGDPNNTVPMNEMGPWVQDALDLIEYANGDTNTIWGALRAANGHPVPYNLKYIQIGNENGGDLYNERYTLFYDAIKAAYPEMHIIACGNWGTPPSSRPREITDEHYYSDPASMLSYATKFDSYDRTGPKVFVGEYAVWSGYGTFGNLYAALTEAAFMTGIERNADHVIMACYAPLFGNVNGTQWRPDLIYYDNNSCFGTPAYYVQQLFSQNRGESVLPNSLNVAGTTVTNQNVGAIGLGTWNTAASYTNLLVTNSSGTLYQSDFVGNGTNGWNVFNGSWNTSGGVYQQTAIITDCRTWTGSTNWTDYTYSLRARKDSGNEGFLIIFDWLDSNNYMWWNIGGWYNGQHGIEYARDGSKTLLASVNGSVSTGVWYDIRVELGNGRIRCYLDDVLIHDIANPTSSASLYASTTYSKTAGQVIVKAVNPSDVAIDTTFDLTGVGSIASNATLIRLVSGSGADENSLASPMNVSPVTTQINNAGTNFTVTLPAYSLSVFRLDASNIDTYTNLALQVNSPINTGQSEDCVVLGQKAGNWFDLTSNTNHAITFRSLNTNVATVDIAGKVVGVGPGIAGIVADYPALGLSATQNLQVTYVPAPLVHRYSFDETSGTNVADSVGGTNWDGTLPNGGTFGGGQLALAAPGEEYVELPPWILSNYTAVTIETWVTFPELPMYCFFFGFGNYNGGTGYDYIFCAPQAGRAAITDDYYPSEQNANTYIDFSFHTNFHLAFVFNPPAGYLAIYTNGALAGINNAVTTTLASVSNYYSWIGRSLYSADPYPNFTLDEFRIYDGALSPGDIAVTEMLGPDQVLSLASPTLDNSASEGMLTLSWPLEAPGWSVLTTTNLASGNWTPIPESPQVISGQWRVTVPIAAREQYYRLQR